MESNHSTQLLTELNSKVAHVFITKFISYFYNGLVDFDYLFSAQFVNSFLQDLLLTSSWNPNEVLHTQYRPVRYVRGRISASDDAESFDDTL